MDGALFKFVPLPQKPKSVLSNKAYSEFLMKWSMKGNLKHFFYNYNQQFLPYQKQEFVDAFFKDPAVYKSLETLKEQTWSPIGHSAECVEYEYVPSTEISMKFFDRILKDENRIIHGDGEIRNTFEELIEGFYVSDELHYMLLDENHKNYNLYTENERNEFIFRLFQHLCLGGQWCQHDHHIKPYMDITKDLYKELMSVERVEGTSEIKVRSIVLKVIAYGANKQPICPKKPSHIQNFVYLIIDPFKRQVCALVHQYEAQFNE